jgi:adenylate kinase family enzyme
MLKVLIFGPPGSGKTTWAKQLSIKYDLPLFHIDRHFFNPDWSKRPQDDFFRDVDVHLELPKWLIDGNGMRTLEMRYKHANIAILLHPPRLICVYRMFYRWLTTLGELKHDGPEGSKNGVTWAMLKYMWNFKKDRMAIVHDLQKKYPQVRFFLVTNEEEKKQVEKMLHAKDN